MLTLSIDPELALRLIPRKPLSMQERRFIVLRSKVLGSPRAAGLPPFMAGAVPASNLETLTIESGELTKKERVELRRDPTTHLIAETMPLRQARPAEINEEPNTSGTQLPWSMEAVLAHKSPFNGAGVKVAILDTGIDAHHPASAGVSLSQRNFTDEGDDDIDGHGTFMAGAIFGRDFGGLRIGVAPGVEHAFIGKVLGTGGSSTLGLAQAVQWSASAGANLISMSLGIDFPGFVVRLVTEFDIPIQPATSIALEQYRANVNLFSALSASIRQPNFFGSGSLIIAPAGSDSKRPQFEIPVTPPAAGTGIVAVGALGQNAAGDAFEVAPFSNTEVDLCGPGVNIISAAPGERVVSWSGTAAASAYVVGAACLWAQKLLEASGRVEIDSLYAQLIGRADTSRLVPGFEENDVGTGMVQAPLS